MESIVGRGERVSGGRAHGTLVLPWQGRSRMGGGFYGARASWVTGGEAGKSGSRCRLEAPQEGHRSGSTPIARRITGIGRGGGGAGIPKYRRLDSSLRALCLGASSP